MSPNPPLCGRLATKCTASLATSANHAIKDISLATTLTRFFCAASLVVWAFPAISQERLTEFAATPFSEGGTPVALEIIIAKPPGPGPFPLLIFHHGSTGRGDDPSLFKRTFTANALASQLNQRGWMVAFPQRRGRGNSGGLYDEGFERDRSRYSCSPDLSLKGLDRAVEDAGVVLEYLAAKPEVDKKSIVVGGVSRGGILSIASAGKEPHRVSGVINWVGGWMSDQCQDPVAINTVSFVQGAKFAGPTLWLYGENDSFYKMAHSRSNFDAFIKAGGQGSFHTFSLGAFKDGHSLLQRDDLWSPVVNAFLNRFASTKTTSESQEAVAGTAESPAGKWTGKWASNKTEAAGELSVQIAAGASEVLTARIRQTRPSNDVWKCAEDFSDVPISRVGQQMSFTISPGGRCSTTAYTFSLQNGKLVGKYLSSSGAEGGYVLVRQ